MKKLLIVFALLLLLGVAVEVSAQEILKGKLPVATAMCSVDKNFVMKKGNPIERECILFVSEDEKGYVLIFDQYGKPAVVVELIVPDGQRIVWRVGQMSL